MAAGISTQNRATLEKSSQPSAEQDHRRQHAAQQNVRQTRRPALFLWTTGTRPHGNRQAHLAPTSRHTRSLHYLCIQSKQKLRVHWLQRRFIQHRQPGEDEVYIREHTLPHWGVIHSGARIFCDDKRNLLLAGQGSYSSRSKHLAIRFMGLGGWIIDDKLVIDHVSTKGQLGDILIKFLAQPIFTEPLNAIINRA